MDVCVEYFVNELMSGYRVESFIKVYYCKKCSESRLYSVQPFDNGLRHVCEERVCGMAGPETVWEGESRMCCVMFCRSEILTKVDGSNLGLYEVSSVGTLLGFRMGTILAIFHDV